MVLAGVLAVVVTAAAACTAAGDDGPAETLEPILLDPAVTDTTPAPAPGTTPTSDEAAIIAAVHGYWDAVLAANSPPNPDHPALARHATGPALERAKQNISSAASLGQAARLPEGSVRQHRPVVISSSVDTAIVRDCAVDDAVVYDQVSGRVLNDAVITTLWKISLEKVGDSWRVARSEAQQRWDGVASCDP